MAAGDGIQGLLRSRGLVCIPPSEGARWLAEEIGGGAGPVIAYGPDPLSAAVPRSAAATRPWAEQRVAGGDVAVVSRPFEVSEPFLRDHRINGVPVLPGVMALALGASAAPHRPPPRRWERLAFHSAIVPRDGALRLALRWTPTGDDTAAFRCREICQPEAGAAPLRLTDAPSA